MPLLETNYLVFIIFIEFIIIYLLLLKFLIEKKKIRKLEEKYADAEKILKDIKIDDTIIGKKM